MPIYEFQCGACGDRFERLQKLSDPDPETCPQCGKAEVKRRLTAPAFRLAGSGWYETDFKKDGDRKRNLAVTDEPPKPKADEKESGAAATTETAPKAAAPAPAAAPKVSGD